MSEQTPQPPREIDRADVLGELEYRFKEADPSHAIAWVLDELTELDILRFREPPECGASEGMSGISCQLPKGHVLPDGSLRTVHEGTTTPEQTETAGYEIFVRWPVDGKTLPGPSVAEAEEPYSVTLVMPCGHDTTEHGPVCPDNVELPDWEREYPEVSGAGVPYPPADPLSLADRQRVAEELVAGNVHTAINIAANRGFRDLNAAEQYVLAMPEYQTGRNHRPVEDVPLVAGTRVFTSDGPEPPQDVECVRFFGTPDRLNGLFLRRSVDLQLRWVWVADPLADVTAMVGDTNWPVPNARGSFTEVV